LARVAGSRLSMKTVLLVEDAEDDVFFLKRALIDSGIQNPLQVVGDGQQALDYLDGRGAYADRTRYPLPFLVLLDLKLPYVMGLDVLKWIRERPEFQTMLVVVLTSSQQDSDITATYRLGGNSYLIKPPNREKLLDLVRSLGEYWLRHNEVPATGQLG
jgi:CheY-like chemotaxis protein